MKTIVFEPEIDKLFKSIELQRLMNCRNGIITYKTTYEVLKELSIKWHKLNK